MKVLVACEESQTVCKEFREPIELIKPYDGKLIAEIPQQVLDQAAELLREAEAADKEWFRLSGIKR